MSRTEGTDERKAQGAAFSERVKARRKELNLTQKQLAVRAKVSTELIQAIEGQRSSNPSFFIALDILRALEVNIREVSEWAGLQN